MPRKPRPPIPDLLIEGLSDHEAMGAVDTFTDDFTGETKPIAPQLVQSRRAVAAHHRKQKALVAATVRKHEDEFQALRKSAAEFIHKKMQPTYRTPAKPGQHSIALGPDLIMISTLPPKPWRRF